MSVYVLYRIRGERPPREMCNGGERVEECNGNEWEKWRTVKSGALRRSKTERAIEKERQGEGGREGEREGDREKEREYGWV